MCRPSTVDFVLSDTLSARASLAARQQMVDASIALYLSFVTAERDDADSIRLQIAAALESEGAEIDTNIHRYEVDWLFYGIRNGSHFTLVLVEIAPKRWFTSLEGATPEEQPSPDVRAWVQPIVESALRSRDGTGEFQWHESHLTLPKP